VSPEQVQHWFDLGLRAVGPAHYGRSHYAYGTATDGPMTPKGVQLLKEFMKVGMILDVTHLSDQSFWTAMDVYDGPMLASHHNLRSLVPGDRQLTDEHQPPTAPCRPTASAGVSSMSMPVLCRPD